MAQSIDTKEALTVLETAYKNRAAVFAGEYRKQL